MTIAIDFDGTWTADPGLWRLFAAACTHSGHRLIMVTGRSGRSEDMERYQLPHTMPIIYTGGAMKEKAALKAGYKVDIWIDDMPAMIQECAVIGQSKDSEL
ncbi:HAD family hydrolase [Prosthecobacter sp. SYSU 5D2]|uniref:HAD family hydrolase n=1 Tax=Prosthecobacter sp. SYSU 5D2 TaxID=3134134 RepID=UPI0031FECD56